MISCPSDSPNRIYPLFIEFTFKYLECKQSFTIFFFISEIDPFTNKLSWSVSDVIKVSILSLTLAPLRLICILLIVIFTWIVSKITLMGITFEESTSTPFTGWRKNLQWLVHKTMRAIAFCMGIHRIKVKGEQVSLKREN